MVRDFKFRTSEVEGLYYKWSEIKGADPLSCAFSHMQEVGFLMTRFYYEILCSTLCLFFVQGVTPYHSLNGRMQLMILKFPGSFLITVVPV